MWGRGIIVAAIVSALLPAAAPATEFEARATGAHGYKISLTAIGDLLAVDVTSGRVGSSYESAAPHVDDSGVRGSLGRFGEVRLTFEATGPAKSTDVRCSDEPRTVTPGVFVGTFRFRGERDYTRLTTSRLKGRRVDSPEVTCIPTTGGWTGYAPLSGAQPQEEPLTFSAGRARAGRTTQFYAGSAAGRIGYLAFQTERFPFVSVLRSAFALGGPGSLVTGDSRLTATIGPPPPFTGHASFDASRGPRNRLHGNLAVHFPGRTPTPLAGPGFKAGFDG